MSNQVGSDISSMSRRTFLRWSAHLASSMVLLSGARFTGTPRARAAPQDGGYGIGPYGEGTYRGRSGNALYLPFVVRKED